MRLSVLGGSSPFTAALFTELSSADQWARPSTIVLHGRNTEALAALQLFAQRYFGVSVLTTTDMEAAVDGADVILHQIRYGGLEGRADDEAHCRILGISADETLGPGGFRAALRLQAGIADTSAVIARIAPLALVINLTNPLSLSTSLMRRGGIDRIVGVCELPTLTGEAIDKVVGEPTDWDYVGFNHRGFLFDLNVNGKPALERVLERMPQEGVCGIPRAIIAELRAVPTKYFRLFLGGAPISPYGRAEQLAGIRRRIMAQLTASTNEPTSLAEREQPWWRTAVVPLLGALRTCTPYRQVVNVPDMSGVTREAWFEFQKNGNLRALAKRARPTSLDRWLSAFEVHELACLDALEHPTDSKLRRVAETDPLTSG